jgi:DNA-binding MarR family transcriptional regulator
LLAVAEEGLQNPSDIAKFVGIDRTATSRALRQLEDDGLIGRAIGRKDRRMTVVSLTQKGFDRLIAAVPTCQENMSHFNAKLTEVEQRELRRLMTKLRDGEDMGLTRF